MAVIYMVSVESESLNADYDDDVIVVAPTEGEARTMAERDVIDNNPFRQLKDPGASVVYPVDAGTIRVVGALVPADER